MIIVHLLKMINFQVQMDLSDKKHIIKYSRKIDSLQFHIEINLSLKKIFDSVSHLNKNPTSIYENKPSRR